MCDSVVALGAETASGHTLFAKNSDRKPGEVQPFVQWPATHHAPGSRLACTHVEIPQVPETYAVMGHSPSWVWGFEHGVNEYGVAIGNHTVFSVEPVEERPGLIGMDLVRLGLERGRTAREALEVIATLLETHGQGGAALAPDAGGYHNSFLLADPHNAWQLETSGRRWVARQVRLAACSNHYSLGARWDIASRDFEAWAREQDLWSREGRVDVAAALRHPGVPGHVSEGRQRRAQALLAQAAGRVDVAHLMALLRDHGEGGPVWTGAGSTPQEERFFTLCAHSEPVHRTSASLVAELPARRPFAWPAWISFSTPCSGVFLPVYLDATIPPALARDREDDGEPAAWHVFERLRAAAASRPEEATPRIRREWSRFEQDLEAERVDVERSARTLERSGESERARSVLARFMEERVGEALQRAEGLAAAVAREGRADAGEGPERRAAP